MDYDELRKEIDSLSTSALEELFKKEISRVFDSSCLYYRTFSRCKSFDSLEKKMKLKHYDKGKKLQDLFGVRVILYFKDDIVISQTLLNKYFDVIDKSVDEEKKDTFKPTRLNYVCRIPESIMELISSSVFQQYPIDTTFEIQIRTVFSEGWHEVEHDLRYKCQKDWEDIEDMSRILNGIFATLETCDWSMLSLCEQLSYTYYKNKNWKAMIRNKLRMRLKDQLSKEIEKQFTNDTNIAKAFFKIDREKLIIFFTMLKIPNNYDNVVYVANDLFIKAESIYKLTPKLILDKINALKKRIGDDEYDDALS